jgi:predicted nuclease of predicted toxin-antitoxin system
VKFLIDMPLSPELAAWLRERGYDAQHAAEVGLERAPDADIIARAHNEGRTVVTADLDYPRLLALGHRSTPSLILFRDGTWSELEVIRRMSDILRMLTPAEIETSIIVVERDRIRRRRLPIDQSRSDESAT